MSEQSKDFMNRRFMIAHGSETAVVSRAKGRKKRRRVFSKVGFRCYVCNVDDPTYGENLIAHHIVPVDVGGHGGMSNLISLCRSCHYFIHELSRQWIKDDSVGQKIWDGISNKKTAKRIFLLASQQSWFDGKELRLYPSGEVERQVASGAMIYLLMDKENYVGENSNGRINDDA